MDLGRYERAGRTVKMCIRDRNGLWKALQDIVMFPFLIVAVLTFVVAGIRHSEFTKRHPYIPVSYTHLQDRQIDCGFVRCPAYLYTLESPELLKEEAQCAAGLGIDAVFTRDTELPFEVAGAVRLSLIHI